MQPHLAFFGVALNGAVFLAVVAAAAIAAGNRPALFAALGGLALTWACYAAQYAAPKKAALAGSLSAASVACAAASALALVFHG